MRGGVSSREAIFYLTMALPAGVTYLVTGDQNKAMLAAAATGVYVLISSGDYDVVRRQRVRPGQAIFYLTMALPAGVTYLVTGDRNKAMLAAAASGVYVLTNSNYIRP